jgi:hypothetical protein
MKRWAAFLAWTVATAGCGGDPFAATDPTTTPSDSGAEGSTSEGGDGDSAGRDSGGVDEDGGVEASTDAPSEACVQYTHHTGLGQTWTDCTPLGTHDQTQATRACQAANKGFCSSTAKNCGLDSSASFGIASNYFWAYSGPSAGHVNGATDPACPSSNDPAWD